MLDKNLLFVFNCALLPSGLWIAHTIHVYEIEKQSEAKVTYVYTRQMKPSFQLKVAFSLASSTFLAFLPEPVLIPHWAKGNDVKKSLTSLRKRVKKSIGI